MSVSVRRDTKSQKRIQNSKIIVRSKTEPREDQVDLCPRIWSREFSQSREGRDRNSSSSSIDLWRKVWRICFYCSCLPICYPCYVSRSLRRRRRGTKNNSVHESNASPKNHKSSDDTIKCKLFDTSGDTMGKTMFHRVSQRKKDSDQRVDVNVILLRSESSPKLERYLLTKREEENNEDELNNVINITKKMSDQPSSVLGSSLLNEKNTEASSDNRTNGASNKTWKSIVQLQKWKKSFRKRNPENISSVLPTTRSKLEVVEEENFESIRSSITEFFDARSVVSNEGQIELNSYETLRNSSRDYFSCDSLKVCQNKKKKRLNVKPLGTRTVECEGIGYKLEVSIFDEGTITNWTGSDLDQLGACSMDIITIIISDNEEVENMLNLNKGLLHYISDNWRGFYPLIMVELINEEDDLNSESNVKESAWCLTTLFGDVYQLRLKENELFENIDWLTDVIGRFYLHSRLYQCSKFYGKGINNLPECPGGCKLSKINKNKRNIPFTRKKVKWKMKSLVKFSKLASETGKKEPNGKL
ncbi:uncharacterized protein [Lepeophtheirus salmonis]|uniref:uncharacterized protein n=1 Tax=Lepeophtheirus salmonis TaxID=72036 RepID=UPI001AE500B4|nr:uncharacterized protein LOC121117882 [Lepeophtheirus salmonis]